MKRRAAVERNTKETQISLELCLDGSGQTDIETGVGFFDHMLEGFARHGLFDLTVKVKGDLQVDDHHTVEDTGIALGTAIRQALGDKRGIVRFGDKILPMDEVLALCALDLGGRPYFSFDAPFSPEKLGDMSGEMVREFFYAVSYSAAMNLHLKILSPGNGHHMAEALFKAFGRALDMAAAIDPRVEGIPSTKGSL
ncbi:MAG TPA: imidazoleglycerol-phosphate dehydratase HisB [Candidatus Merdiplasma excrementigallinarum]|uniref:Imidazoleglycerol-phosphate dehydratase n=1 Tax=Candidatus Merdiplasma excrementigallinarum TaxID=2840864 RepID=A0A9D1NZZ4_9FIRM|nr:imidazoleglycerol-phosphate dehydratase HisB [Candidatus Merdiplasma excrementigallinarum]